MKLDMNSICHQSSAMGKMRNTTEICHYVITTISCYSSRDTIVEFAIRLPRWMNRTCCRLQVSRFLQLHVPLYACHERPHSRVTTQEQCLEPVMPTSTELVVLAMPSLPPAC